MTIRTEAWQNACNVDTLMKLDTILPPRRSTNNPMHGSGEVGLFYNGNLNLAAP
jgi:hypothetical protein